MTALLRRVRVGLAVAGVALVSTLVGVAVVTVPPAGWTTGDITTGNAPAYPDLQTRRYDAPPDMTLAVHAAVANRLLGWHVVQTDQVMGQVTMEARPLLGFSPDQIIATITPDGRYSRVSIRAHSADSRPDLGSNARHIRDLQAAVDVKLPPAPPPVPPVLPPQ